MTANVGANQKSPYAKPVGRVDVLPENNCSRPPYAYRVSPGTNVKKIGWERLRGGAARDCSATVHVTTPFASAAIVPPKAPRMFRARSRAFPASTSGATSLKAALTIAR